MKTIKAKIVLFMTVALIFTSCSESAEDKIILNAKEVINKDLSDDISINVCLYNKESNAVYIKFHSDKQGNDEAIIFLNDNSIFYESIYSTIKKDDYEKIIEYGDYAVLMYQLTVNGNNDQWIVITDN